VRRLSVVFLLLGATFVGCSRDGNDASAIRRTCQAVKGTVRCIYRIEKSVVGKAKSPDFVSLDVEGLSAEDLKEQLLALGDPETCHLWMPGEKSWIVVRHQSGAKVSLSMALEQVANDPSCTVSLPVAFSSYAGKLSDILPAFESDLQGVVVPEWFVTREIPSIDWLVTKGVDKDILKPMLAEIRSMQVVRREILRGNMLARAAKDKKGEEEACEVWAKSFLRNPEDSLLRERIANLEGNAKGFLDVGKFLQALKCYETILLIQPDNISALHNFGLLLKKIGRVELGKKAISRAQALMKSKR